MATLINRVVRPLIGTLLALILGALAVGQMSAWWGAPGVLGYASNRTDRWNVYLLDTQRGLDWPSIVGETPLRPATFDWSPDCQRLVFVSNRPGGSVLGTLDLGTGTATQLRQNDTKFVMSYPRWSPDGTRILYAEDKTGTGRDVRVMDMTTGNISTLLSDLQGGAYPSWHPSGSHVIFTDTVDGQADIFTVDVTTRQRSQITDNATRESSPIYSPDGASIAYTDGIHSTHPHLNLKKAH